MEGMTTDPRDGNGRSVAWEVGLIGVLLLAALLLVWRSLFVRYILLEGIVWLIVIGVVAGVAGYVVLVSKGMLADAPPLRKAGVVAVVGGMAVVATLAGVAVAGDGTGFVGGETPTPPRPLDPIAQSNEVLRYAEGLEYLETLHGAGDAQLLSLSATDTAGLSYATGGGPLAAIYPEENAHRNKPRAWARPGQGRVVAKVYVDSASRGYPKLGLRPGWNYLWVDVVDEPVSADTLPASAVSDSARRLPPDLRYGPTRLRDGIPDYPSDYHGAWSGRIEGDTVYYRVVVIPGDGSAPTALPMRYWDHVDPAVGSPAPWFKGYNMPRAGWLYRHDDPNGWSTCDKHGCCEMGPT